MTTVHGESEENTEQALLAMATESWRLSRLFVRVLSKLDAGDADRYLSQLRFFQKKLEESLESCGLKLVNVEGQVYDPGIAATPLNIADFAPEEALVVEQMLEPIIMGQHGLKKQGTIKLRKMHL